jgi:anti-anti-sigma factor
VPAGQLYRQTELRTNARLAVMTSHAYPVQWTGKQAIVTLPEHIDVTNVGQIRDELLALINHGAATLIADMTATLSCDHAGAGAMARAHQRAIVSGTQLRLVVTSKIVSRVLSIEGIDRLVSIYPSLEAATAARSPLELIHAVPAQRDGSAPRRRSAWVMPGRRNPGPRSELKAAVITPDVLWKLVNALADGVALTDDEGVLVLVNSRLNEMFGYHPGELTGLPVESLVPEDLRAAHRGHRSAYAQASTARPMGTGARFVGLRKDGATFPVDVSLSPVANATGQFALAVVRDVSDAGRRHDLADLARAAAAVKQARRERQLLDGVVNSLFHLGISLQTAIDLPHDIARRRITEALQRVDDTIRSVQDYVFSTRDQAGPSHPPPPGRSP